MKKSTTTPAALTSSAFHLIPNSSAAVSTISTLIRERLLANAPPMWREAVQEYEDEHNYLSLSIATHPGKISPVVAIEFGVQDADTRRATGIFLAHWRRAERVIGPIETVLIDSTNCDPSAFVAKLASYLGLTSTIGEFAEYDAA